MLCYFSPKTKQDQVAFSGIKVPPFVNFDLGSFFGVKKKMNVVDCVQKYLCDCYMCAIDEQMRKRGVRTVTGRELKCDWLIMNR